MSRPLFVQAEYTVYSDPEGELPDKTVPDLGDLPPLIDAHMAPVYNAQWLTGGHVHTFTFLDIGLIEGARWFFGSGDANIGGALASAGVPPSRWTHKPDATLRAALIAAGVRTITRDSDGEVVGFAPNVVPAGESPMAIGLDGLAEDGETYTEST